MITIQPSIDFALFSTVEADCIISEKTEDILNAEYIDISICRDAACFYVIYIVEVFGIFDIIGLGFLKSYLLSNYRQSLINILLTSICLHKFVPEPKL